MKQRRAAQAHQFGRRKTEVACRVDRERSDAIGMLEGETGLRIDDPRKSGCDLIEPLVGGVNRPLFGFGGGNGRVEI